MSQQQAIICPNCRSEAVNDYCSRCGQATHLHDETFSSLAVHFIAHYFHFESKFWQTIKTLWLKPGALTIAYREKKRVRFVPPMSLYLFTVIAYFILSTFVDYTYEFLGMDADQQPKVEEGIKTDRAIESSTNVVTATSLKAIKKINYVLDHHEEYNDKVSKILSKISFFMVPLFALFLSLVFLYRKDVFFLDHIIFSFHTHTMLFCVLLVSDLSMFAGIYEDGVTFGVWLWMFLYCLIAMKRVYNIGWIRAFIFSAIALTLNLCAFFILLMASLVLVA